MSTSIDTALVLTDYRTTSSAKEASRGNLSGAACRRTARSRTSRGCCRARRRARRQRSCYLTASTLRTTGGSSGTLEQKMRGIGMFDRKDPLSLEGFAGSGAD